MGMDAAAFGGVTTVCDFAIQWDKTKSLTKPRRGSGGGRQGASGFTAQMPEAQPSSAPPRPLIPAASPFSA